MKVNLIYSDDCPHCQDVLEALEAQGGIPDKEITLVELATDLGIEHAQKFNLDVVPTAVTEDGIRCEIKFLDGNKIDVSCPKEPAREE